MTQQGNILAIDTNPETHMVTSPDGRVFCNMEVVVSAMALEMILLQVKAKADNDQRELDRIEGARSILKAILDTHDKAVVMAQEEAVLRNATDGIDVSGLDKQ